MAERVELQRPTLDALQACCGSLSVQGVWSQHICLIQLLNAYPSTLPFKTLPTTQVLLLGCAELCFAGLLQQQRCHCQQLQAAPAAPEQQGECCMVCAAAATGAGEVGAGEWPVRVLGQLCDIKLPEQSGRGGTFGTFGPDGAGSPPRGSLEGSCGSSGDDSARDSFAQMRMRCMALVAALDALRPTYTMAAGAPERTAVRRRVFARWAAALRVCLWLEGSGSGRMECARNTVPWCGCMERVRDAGPWFRRMEGVRDLGP